MDFRKDKKKIDGRLQSIISVGPFQLLYAADLAEGRMDTDVSRCHGLLLAVDVLIAVVALYECH
jgi:hypothetical protein